MSSAKPEKAAPTRSVAVAMEKTRLHRVERLKKTLADKLGDPVPILDALMTELADGAEQTELWNVLDAAAKRDGIEAALGEAYRKCANGPRMKRLPRAAQAVVLLRAANFFEKALGDDPASEHYLERVLDVVPGHAEAFARLEARVEKALDSSRLVALCAKVASVPPKPATVLATQALNKLVLLSPKTPLADEICRQLVALVSANPKVLDALDKHCCATKRPLLACALTEDALRTANAEDDLVVQWRERLIELYMGEAESPPEAMPHVEELLNRDATHAKALDTAERLLGTRKVATRAAAALRNARRARGY